MTEPPDIVGMGLDEIALRSKLGDAGYEDLKTRQDLLNAHQVEQSAANVAASQAAVELSKAQAAYVRAKTSWWSALTLAVLVLVVGGVVEGIRALAG